MTFNFVIYEYKCSLYEVCNCESVICLVNITSVNSNMWSDYSLICCEWTGQNLCLSSSEFYKGVVTSSGELNFL